MTSSKGSRVTRDFPVIQWKRFNWTVRRRASRNGFTQEGQTVFSVGRQSSVETGAGLGPEESLVLDTTQKPPLVGHRYAFFH